MKKKRKTFHVKVSAENYFMLRIYNANSGLRKHIHIICSYRHDNHHHLFRQLYSISL